MTKLAREPYGPKGDPYRHLCLTELRAGLAALPPEPDAERGRVACIVRRLADGGRETLGATELSVELGVPGDGWSRRPPRDPEAQIAVMRNAVARLIANGQDLSLFGDNFFVDFDISAANLPPGSRLRVGAALVEVTPQPHNGCAKFHERFGDDALRFVQAPATRHRNLRGIFWKVLEGGRVRTGDPIAVMTRPDERGAGG